MKYLGTKTNIKNALRIVVTAYKSERYEQLTEYKQEKALGEKLNLLKWSLEPFYAELAMQKDCGRYIDGARAWKTGHGFKIKKGI